MLYCNAPAPVAFTAIEPSVVPQSVGFCGVTLTIVGVIGFTRITSTAVSTQVPSTFLTLIWYVPPATFWNKPPFAK
mgnify:CR=1 FL=1